MKNSSHRACGSLPLIGLGALLLLAPVWTRAQSQTAGTQVTAPRLMIMIIGGEEPLRNMKQRVAREVIVEVHDESDRPVGAGVSVTMQLLKNGKAVTATTVTTGANGQATLSLTPAVGGRANLSFTAALGGQTGSLAVPVTVGSIVPAAAAAGTAAAVGTTGSVVQNNVATKDCTGLFDANGLTLTEQACSGFNSPATSPQCASAVQRLLTQFGELCSCVGGIAVPQLYTQYGMTTADIDLISSYAKTVGFTLPASCTSPNAPTIIRTGPPVVGGPGE